MDEAYADYADYSLLNDSREYGNVVILRTFSKAYGLAGIRLGYAVTNEQLSQFIKTRYQMPYAVSQLTMEIGIQLLKKQSVIMNAVKETKKVKAWLTKRLNGIDGIQAFKSETNFVLFNLPINAEKIYSYLLEKGIIVRKYGRILTYPNCLRVTVAPKPILEKFIDSLIEVL